MNILITGCNGQLGNEMLLLEKDNMQHTFSNTDVRQLDITNRNAVDEYVEGNAIDCIVNCAAYTAVDRAESDSELCNLLNETAPAYLASAVNHHHYSVIDKAKIKSVYGLEIPYWEDSLSDCVTALLQ